MEQSRWPALFNQCATRRLTWWPEIGVGYYPVEEGTKPYDSEYFARYQRQADTDIGRKLMDARVYFVARHYPRGPVVDVGIGSGAFIDARDAWGEDLTFGYDVNPNALDWLEMRAAYLNVYRQRVEVITLWDVLEHIADFPRLLANVTTWAFVSIPIFRDCDHVLRSKHYRKDEHCFYFTADGLIGVMRDLGFECIEQNDMETQLGREDIGSFAFRRI